MSNRSYSRPFYDANGFFSKVFEGEAFHMTAEEFAVFKARLEDEREMMAERREAFFLARAVRLEELRSRDALPTRWINPENQLD